MASAMSANGHPPADDAPRVEWALWYATALGWAVFPVHGMREQNGQLVCTCPKGADCDEGPGKHPDTFHGSKDASTDPDVIRAWWEAKPHANIGSPHPAILDCDLPRGSDPTDGVEAFRKLERKHGIVAGAAIAKSGGGGLHVYFTANGEQGGHVAGGLSLRGRGLYAVLPPSVHPSGNPYRWERPPLAGRPLPPLPEWLKKQQTAAAKRLKETIENPGELIPANHRHDAIAAYVGMVRKRNPNLTEREALAVAHQFRLDRCERPEEKVRDVEELIAYVYSKEPPEPERQYEFCGLDDFLKHPFPQAEPLLGEAGQCFLAVGSLLLVYGADGAAKSTWTIDGIAHMAAGQTWLGIPVPRPVRFLVIENEGPPALFQQKLSEKAETWEGESWRQNVMIYADPWGAFSFADVGARAALTAFCDQHKIDVVVANPTLGLGVAGSGKPEETQSFMDWLVECGLKSSRAFWLLHHENKAGQISGDWGRHPDTKVQLQADGRQPRTRLIWEKTRWAVLPTEEQPKSCMLEWIIETKGYRPVEIAVGATDGELEARLVLYLIEHPLSTTNNVTANVQGTTTKLRKLLQQNPRFDSIQGARGASQWFLRDDCVADTDDADDA
jgi:Bifunctional DNA primase/polymerase, N-terminal/AAA domain